jgi:hypothetical protein
MNRSTMLLLMCPIVAIAGQPTPPPDSATADQPFSAERWLTHVPSGEVDFDGRPLREVVAWLRDRDQTGAPADMNIVVNWRSLEAAGIDKDSEVTLHLKQVPLARILSLVLDQFSSEAKLGYVV